MQQNILAGSLFMAVYKARPGEVRKVKADFRVVLQDYAWRNGLFLPLTSLLVTVGHIRYQQLFRVSQHLVTVASTLSHLKYSRSRLYGPRM